jgi:uncharacterized metal-binding protein
MARLLLIPCSHLNREGEIVLRACYSIRNKYPRKVMIVTPPTIGASPLLLASFGIEPENYVAVNGCNRRCVDCILATAGIGSQGRSFVLSDKSSEDPKSVLAISNEDVFSFAKKLEYELAKDLGKP